MALRSHLIVGALLASASFLACSAPVQNQALDVRDADAPTEGAGDDDDDGPVLPVTPVLAADCADACTPAAKRCSATTSAGVEVCAKGESGCFEWTQESDCAAGSSCDRTKNDGTCAAGCENDSGCSASNVGSEICATESGRSRIRCAKVGSCFQWSTATSCAPDTVCKGGSCVTQCTNVCTAGAMRCTGSRSREKCVKGAGGCTVWASTSACSPDEQCAAGGCQ